MQPSILLMIRPAAFGFNTETAATNTFQQEQKFLHSALSEKAKAEFDQMTSLLAAHDIELIVIEDIFPPARPDAVFPNNWFSVHPNKIIIYPMLAPNRRTEVRDDIIRMLCDRFSIQQIIDLRSHCEQNRFLEGTGSIVFDYAHRIAYAAISPRTDHGLVEEICRAIDFTPVCFETIPFEGVPVYHTNVMMALHPRQAVVCKEMIAEPDRERVMNLLSSTRESVVEISRSQVEQFAGNMLFVRSRKNDQKLIVSQRAWNSLEKNQQEKLRLFAEAVIIPLDLIESVGGGSVRCMMAELDPCFAV